MTIEIRPLIRTDHDAWLPLWQGYQEFYGVALDPAISAVTWSRMLDPGEPVAGLGAFDGDRLVGIVHYLFHRSTWMAVDTCYLQDLFVTPDMRGAGVARALIEGVYAAADAAGAGQVYWLTHETNTTARRLYDTLATNTGFIAYERFVEVGGGG